MIVQVVNHQHHQSTATYSTTCLSNLSSSSRCLRWVCGIRRACGWPAFALAPGGGRWKMRDLLSCKCEDPASSSSRWCSGAVKATAYWLQDAGGWLVCEGVTPPLNSLYMPGEEIVCQWSSKRRERLWQKRGKGFFLKPLIDCLLWLGSLHLFT